jgi:pyruvate,water dikinase
MSPPLSLPLHGLGANDVPFAGGKACALAALLRAGVEVPHGIVVTTHAYRRFLASTGLRERIALELRRKEIADMRWEELWDASLRVRNFFLTTGLPDDLRTALTQGLRTGGLTEVPLAVRSSAPGEDAASASFAGIHESYVNVRGEESVLHHIKLVWASLWSDGALLYRRELKLDPQRSAMAVVVQ